MSDAGGFVIYVYAGLTLLSINFRYDIQIFVRKKIFSSLFLTDMI